MNADAARLNAHLDREPDDRVSRQVLADLLDDEGLPQAARFQRWLVENGLWPDSNLSIYFVKGWHWWGSVEEMERSRSHAVVPIEIQPFMPAGEWIFPTRAEAEAVLGEALARSEEI